MDDTSLLKPFDPFDIMDAECARLDAFFSSLDDTGWTKDTRNDGWRVRELLAHLASVELYNRACLEDTVKNLFAEAAANDANDMDGFNDWQVRIRADTSTDEVLSEWREGNDSFRSEMRRRGRDGSVATSVGPYPVELQAFHLASEYATHADDMGVAVPDAERAGRLAWRLAFSAFGLQEAEKPVEVEPGDGKQTVRSNGKEATLSDHDFVEAVTARLPKDHPLDPELRDALRALA